MSNIHLYCLPFAGTSVCYYSNWRKYLPDNIILNLIEFPGRGRRYNENWQYSIKQLAQDAYKQIDFNHDFILWGHSLGAIVAFEMAYLINDYQSQMPQIIFFSGMRSPQTFNAENNNASFSAVEYWEKFNHLRENNRQIIENPDLFNFFKPVIEADLNAINEYKYTPRPKLNVDFCILTGTKDVYTYNKTTGWKTLTTKKCSYYTFSGGHFFIDDSSAITSFITKMIQKDE